MRRSRPLRVRAAALLYPLVAALALFAIPAMADSGTTMLQLRELTFKENGRIDPEIRELCDARQSLQNVFMEHRKQSPATVVEVDVRIDKMVRLGMGNAGVRWGGLELAVTASPAASPDRKNQFFCRSPVMGIGGRISYCPEIVHCSREIAKNIDTWLRIIASTPATP